jgi:hypothetical protein
MDQTDDGALISVSTGELSSEEMGTATILDPNEVTDISDRRDANGRTVRRYKLGAAFIEFTYLDESKALAKDMHGVRFTGGRLSYTSPPTPITPR